VTKENYTTSAGMIFLIWKSYFIIDLLTACYKWEITGVFYNNPSLWSWKEWYNNVCSTRIRVLQLEC